jgi:formylglycine-generating enzyme
MKSQHSRLGIVGVESARRLLAIACYLCVGLEGLQAQVTFDWALVGNPGNSPDGTGFGEVSYHYRIAKHEVTNDQYRDFLNAVDAGGANPNALYNAALSSDPRGGIEFDAMALSGSKYASKPNMGNKPVIFVSFRDSIRFVNWLENGQPTDGSGTESGAYVVGTSVSEVRSPGATYFIPSGNEWYKASYHDPRSEAQGGPLGNDNYWLYSTMSDAAPTVAIANAVGDISNPGMNVVNHASGADWNGLDGHVTTVGSAGAGSASYYGTWDQSGNVWEWSETLFINTFRCLRGGSWSNPSRTSNQFSCTISSEPGNEGSNNIGFRVASVPEPGSGILIALGTIALLRRRRSLPSQQW